MDKKLHLKAAYGVKSVYAGNCHNIGSTEWASTIVNHGGVKFQLLAVGGTDEFIDWFWNLLLFSWDGVKICSYLSAHMIHSGTWGDFEWIRKAFGHAVAVVRRICRVLRCRPLKGHTKVPVFTREPGLPLVVAVHSKSGPTGMYWKRKFGADLCLAFCPARGFRNEFFLAGTIMYVDPDDPVPQLAKISFRHPKCEVVTLPDDPGWRIRDHPIDHIIEYLKTNKGGSL